MGLRVTARHPWGAILGVTSGNAAALTGDGMLSLIYALPEAIMEKAPVEEKPAPKKRAPAKKAPAKKSAAKEAASEV